MINVYDPYPDCVDSILENCCICRTPTEFWCQAKDVALCKKCAEQIELEDVPSTLDWILKEQLIDDD